MKMNKEINRNKVLVRNITGGLFLKVLNMILALILIPLLISYLGDTAYGIWVTLFSMLAWMNTLDIGIGNGLKIQLSAALAKNNEELANNIISTSYCVIIFITFILLVISIIPLFYLDILSLLNIGTLNQAEVKTAFVVGFIFMLINFVFSLYKNLLFATHKSYFVELANVLSQLLIIFSLVIFNEYFTNPLLFVAFITGISPLITSLIATYIFFIKENNLHLNLKNFRLKYVKIVTSTSIKLFIVQISMLIILSTDNFIIARYINPESVTTYSITNKFFILYISLWYLILGPMNALFADAYYKNDKEWIKKIFKKLHFALALLFIIVFISCVFFEYIVDLWIREDFYFPDILPFLFAAFVILRMFTEIYSTFLNSINKFNKQLPLIVFGALLNIPLSIYLATVLELGSPGVILGTIFSFVPLAISLPFFASLELKKIYDIK